MTDDTLLKDTLEVLDNVWVDPKGTKWVFAPTVGDFISIKRTQGVDFIEGKFPESIYPMIDASEVMLGDQLIPNGVELPVLADRIVNDPEGFQKAFLAGVTLFFLNGQQQKKAGNLLTIRLNDPNLTQLVHGDSSSDSPVLLASILDRIHYAKFGGCAKGQTLKSMTQKSER